MLSKLTVIYEIKNILKTYPGQLYPVNNNINLQIYAGEIFGILGDNGAGKSSLIRQMVNLLSSNGGEIFFLEKSILKVPYLLQMNVGYMPQESSALNNLTIKEALYFSAHLRGMNRQEAHQECARLLDLWQIHELRNKPSSRLSGGQKRLLRLAVAMASSPPVMILDEPTNDLDPQRRKLVWDILRQQNQNQGTTIILITHDAIEAEKAIQRVGIMHQGNLVVVGKPRELKQEVDKMLRLELFFSPETPPNLPPNLSVISLEPGHWRFLLEWSQVNNILNNLELTLIDDFRLYSATLEDLYLYYTNNPKTTLPNSTLHTPSSTSGTGKIKRNPQHFIVQLIDLFLMELTNWRWSWQALIINSIAAPILGIIALGSFAKGTGEDTLAYILTGNLVMSLMFGTLDKVATRFTFMKFSGALDYFATLPISREALIIATVLAFFLLSLPSLLVIILLGAFYLKLSLIISPLIILIIPLCVISLSGIGAVIGTNAPSPEVGSSLSLLVTMILLFIGPVLIPANRLPDFLIIAGYFSPASYAASAIRQTLLGTISQQILIDIFALLGFSVLSFWIARRKFNWRQR